MSLVCRMEITAVRRNAIHAMFHILLVASGRLAPTQRFINQVDNRTRAMRKHKEILRPLTPASLFIFLYIGLNATCNWRAKTKQQNRQFSILPNIREAMGARNDADNPINNQVIHLDSILKSANSKKYKMKDKHIKYK